MQLKYVCRLSNNCETTSGQAGGGSNQRVISALRSMCRSCRYMKCLRVGMKKTAVQRYVDRLDPASGIEHVNGLELSEISVRCSLLIFGYN